jgi:hypothetical protein
MHHAGLAQGIHCSVVATSDGKVEVQGVGRQENEKTSCRFLSVQDRKIDTVLYLIAPQPLAKLHSYE